MPFVRGQGSIVSKTAQTSLFGKLNLFRQNPKKIVDAEKIADKTLLQKDKPTASPSTSSKAFF